MGDEEDQRGRKKGRVEKRVSTGRKKGRENTASKVPALSFSLQSRPGRAWGWRTEDWRGLLGYRG